MSQVQPIKVAAGTLTLIPTTDRVQLRGVGIDRTSADGALLLGSGKYIGLNDAWASGTADIRIGNNGGGTGYENVAGTGYAYRVIVDNGNVTRLTTTSFFQITSPFPQWIAPLIQYIDSTTSASIFTLIWASNSPVYIAGSGTSTGVKVSITLAPQGQGTVDGTAAQSRFIDQVEGVITTTDGATHDILTTAYQFPPNHSGFVVLRWSARNTGATGGTVNDAKSGSKKYALESRSGGSGVTVRLVSSESASAGSMEACDANLVYLGGSALNMRVQGIAGQTIAWEDWVPEFLWN